MTQYEKGYKFGYAQALLDLEERIFSHAYYLDAQCMKKMGGEKDDSD